jgi:hypothetical protein
MSVPVLLHERHLHVMFEYPHDESSAYTSGDVDQCTQQADLWPTLRDTRRPASVL